MAKIVFLYSTVDGHTRDICERLAEIVERRGNETALVELHAGEEPDLSGYDRIVIGASVRYGKHRPEVARFIDANRELLESRPSAFFSVNAVARKPEKNSPDTNPYVKKFLRGISWRPETIEIFGGKIDYPSYGFWDRTIIRLIMWMTKGPTDRNTVVDFTDWQKVDAFGERIAA